MPHGVDLGVDLVIDVFGSAGIAAVLFGDAVLIDADFTGFYFKHYEVALGREDDDVDLAEALGLLVQAGPLDAVVSVEAIGESLLELLEYFALAVGAAGGEFDVGQGRMDDGHGVTFFEI